MHKNLTGIRGEEIACSFLEKRGYVIVERNFICRWGELDIIAIFDHILVFVEVKTRKTELYGNPEASIGYFKKRALLRASNYYLLLNRIDQPIRFDVITVSVTDGVAHVRHYVNCSLT